MSADHLGRVITFLTPVRDLHYPGNRLGLQKLLHSLKPQTQHAQILGLTY